MVLLWKPTLTNIATELMKRCSTSFLMRKMQIKNTMRYYYTFTRMIKFKRLTVPSVTKNMKQEEISYLGGVNVKFHNLSGKQFNSFS